MGMFDSFLIDIGDHTVELQTKRFDCDLNRIRIGEAMSGAPAGVQVYFIRDRLGDNFRLSYEESEATANIVIFVVLVQGVFTACEVVRESLDNATIRARLASLRETWSDSGRVLSRWAEFIGRHQNRVAQLDSHIAFALSTIHYAREIRNDPQAASRHTLFKRPEEERIERGEDILDVLEDLLKSGSAMYRNAHPLRLTGELDDFAL